MNILKKLVGTSNALTGTTEERQTRMDEICRDLVLYQDLNSIRANVNEENSFRDLFQGWNDQLKQPTPQNRDRGNGFVWNNKKRGNPVILDGAVDIPMEDRLSYSFMLDGNLVDYFQPDHYRSSAVQYSMVFGSTPANPEGAIGLQGNWRAVIGNQQRSWWVYTAVLLPRGSAEDWFDEFVRLNWCVNSYDEYSQAVEEARTKRESEWAAKSHNSNSRGRLLASNI